MLYQALFRLLKWILTGDPRTILAEKHDTRPHMILLRLVLLVLGAVVFGALFLAADEYARGHGDLLELLALLFIPALIALALLFFIGLILWILSKDFLRWARRLVENPEQAPEELKRAGDKLAKILWDPWMVALYIALALAYINHRFISK